MRTFDATPDMAERLTDLAVRSKASWGYKARWMDLWKKDLTIAPDYIEQHIVKVAVEDGALIGFAALNIQDSEIDHFWVEPSSMRKGAGRILFRAITEAMKEKQISETEIVSDPNAEGFYLSMGAKRVGVVESVPPGRLLPRLTFSLNQPGDGGNGYGRAKS